MHMAQANRPGWLAGQKARGILFVMAAATVAAIAYQAIYPVFLMQVMSFAVLAAAFNLLLGQVGLLSLGHAAFFGAGAYATGYALKYWGLTPELALFFAVAVSGMLGLVIGAVAIRRDGIHFAMITLALAQVIFFTVMQWRALGGDNGLQGVPRGRLFGLIDLESNSALYVFVVLVSLLCLAAIQRITMSPFGALLRAIRQNEARVVSLGYDVQRYKLSVFVLSAVFAGIAGGLKALIVQLVTLIDISFFVSGEAVLMALLGGIGYFAGGPVGAAIVILLQFLLAQGQVPVPMILGALFVVCTIFFPQGIVGAMSRLYRDRKSGRSAGEP